MSALVIARAALGWLRANIIPALIMAALLITLGLFGWEQWQALRGVKTEVKVQAGQTGAAIASGHDAVQTIGNTQARETKIQQTVKDGTDEIDKAPAGDSNDASDRAACRMRAYRHSPKCVALFGAAP